MLIKSKTYLPKMFKSHADQIQYKIGKGCIQVSFDRFDTAISRLELTPYGVTNRHEKNDMRQSKYWIDQNLITSQSSRQIKIEDIIKQQKIKKQQQNRYQKLQYENDLRISSISQNNEQKAKTVQFYQKQLNQRMRRPNSSQIAYQPISAQNIIWQLKQKITIRCKSAK